MRRLISALATMGLLVAVPTSVTVAADPPPGWLAHLTVGRVEYVRQNPSYPCIDIHLVVKFAVGTMLTVAKGGAPWDEHFANATYWATNECTGGDVAGPRLWGQVEIGSDDFSFDGLRSATISGVSIPVSGSGYSQLIRLEGVALAATSRPTSRNVHNGVLLPPGGAGAAAWGERYNEHYVTAEATGTITGEAYEILFTADDVVYADIGKFMQIWR